MKKIIKKAISHPLISGSVIIFSGTLFANVFNFLFNLYMSRNLSIADYGNLASLVSLILLCALAADSFAPTIVSFAGSYFAKGEQEKINDLFFQITKISFLVGCIILVIFILFTKDIGFFFNIQNNFWIILVGVIILFGYTGSATRAILQAKLSFKYISFIGIFSSLLKLIAGGALVFFGYGVTGALWGFLLSFLTSYLLSLIPLRNFFRRNTYRSHTDMLKLFSYGGPATLALIGMTLFITTDIMLVKHFFSSKEAGLYAGLSLIGRVIYFFSAPIGLVMFPLIVHKHAKEEDFKHIFKLSLSIVFLLSVSVSIFYFLFPTFVIRFFLKKEEYLAITPFVGLFGGFITIYSLVAILTNFYLSIKKTYIFIPIIVTAGLQVILIWVYHATFLQIILMSTLSVSLLFFYYLLYYWRLYGRKH